MAHGSRSAIAISHQPSAIDSDSDSLQTYPGLLLDVLVQRIPVRVHRHDSREIFDAQVPHRFGRTEFHQRHAVHRLYRARVELRRAADGVEVHGALLFHRGERFRAHAALADHHADAVALDDLTLVRLLAHARRRPGGGHPPAVPFFHDHRTTVIQARAAQIDWRL